MSLMQRVRNFFSPTPPPQEEDSGQDDEFKARYQAFRRLLSANNTALDIMTDLESAALGHRHFGMHFLRSRVTGATAKVFSIVENLLFLAPGKYLGLRDAMRSIQENIQQELSLRQTARRNDLILDLDRITARNIDDVGGKMANLGELRNALQVPVPDGFAITAQAYMTFMQHSGLWDEINCLVLGHPMASHFAAGAAQAPEPDEEPQTDQPIALLEMCAKIRGMILAAEVPPELESAILGAYDRLCEREGSNVRVALRSSALGEDSAGASFAGQHRSLLNLDRDSLVDGYKEIIASKYSAHAMTYRYMLGIRDDDVLMCVGCLGMVTSQAGGVAYTANPLNGVGAHVRITSAWGVAKGVVDGTATTDEFIVEKEPQPRIIERKVPRKESSLVCSAAEGVCRVSVDPALCEQPTLSDPQIMDLATMAVRIEKHYDIPQDIEWAYSPEGRLVLLQTRPLEVRQDQSASELLPGVTPLVHEGQTASAGTAHGVVHIVRKDVDILVLPDNAILVCVEAAPKWAAVLNRCQGVITEQGSVAGHLANVAREFKVPGLFGVPSATSILETGQEITLDADNCAVYAGLQETLLDRKPQRPNMMAGSPVFQTLQRVNRHIIPLNLLDPDGLDFTPANCKTLHDITRFCHEKSVQEMFSFGRDHNFSPRSSKQLKTIVPMQWWIINLEDGFVSDTGDKMIPLDKITSVPMLALWRGIVAYPWDGPPCIDCKGFMSVLFQSATNRNLEPAMASQFSERNYFMISKHFCNLQSRFGYHFTSVEALAGPRPRENYIRFQFKGGAADHQRKVRRAKFVGEILDEFNFRTRVREDALFARLDDCDQKFIENHLEILGHILIHTRQLDMIMNKEDVVQFYKKRILNQLHAMMDAKNKA
ncbi:pyruvate, water dikinase [Desulfomicrobium norvegicum]|uniref:Phosphoenolpyruvate synthase n=1 Tax=Desulfomicrobium norvegicum (strain DSM 1741 / NCIMB 8310) TaxID=52561 RepID=A0A8G2F5U9_DESNO|nr:PEP/pyruvate-binding domain-containing protein [Desulfomicrobium norvegicum]SFL26540.1 pyruvate, water dikinase [Desulfomicrobium norvegicum]